MIFFYLLYWFYILVHYCFWTYILQNFGSIGLIGIVFGLELLHCF